MHGWEVVEAFYSRSLGMTAPMRKRSRKLRRRRKYFGTKSRGRPGCLESKIVNIKPFRNFQRFNSFGSASAFAASCPVSPSVTCCRCGRVGHYTEYCKAPMPTRPRQGTSQTLSNNINCSTFSDNTSCVSDDLLVNCIEEVGSNCCPGLGQIDSELGSKVYTEGRAHQSPNVKNRLTESISFWEQMGASPWILKILREGYSLPFVQQPPQVSFRNNNSALDSSDFVMNEIHSLLEQGCIREVKRFEAHVMSPLSVAHNGSKSRLILDLSYLNQSISVPKFKYEDIRCVRDLFEKGDYFFKFDIRSGYHHINILEAHQTYLAFAWDFEGVTKYFVFTVLVFGLASAPFVFTKVVKVLIKYWRASSIRIFGYVDDVFGGRILSQKLSKFHRECAKIFLTVALLKTQKNLSGDPVQEGEHLSFIVNLKNGSFSVTPSRVQKFKSLSGSVSLIQ